MAGKKDNAKIDPNVTQRKASDPATSVWVTASAGTGKTKVLTDRTLRLMLEGARPDQILCLTFTRAAASVMTNRIRDELGSWATCDEETLKEKLTKLTGRPPEAATITRARQMFAEFLDAHGEMRIQTIHSFSQALLRRFPIESGIPPYFDVMDDQTVAEELREAQADVLKEISRDPHSPLAKAVGMVTPEVAEDDFVSLITELTYRRGQLMSIFKEHGGLEGTIDAVYNYLGAPKGTTPENLNAQLVSDKGLGGTAPDLKGLAAAAKILAMGTPAEQQKALLLQSWLDHPEKHNEGFKEYLSLFLTSEGEVRKRLTTKATATAEDTLRDEADRLLAGIDAVRTLNVAQGTESLLRMSDAILRHYSDKKRSLNLLDYDDLVYHAGQMMKREDHAVSWVLQKLPGDLKHILVDEGQDTNPDQWQLISAIVEEFFTGPGRKKSKDNTVFVVGDEKQSIFSFQRADPDEFSARKKFFADLVHKSGGKWQEVDMEIAFRSSPAITQAVDAVFANPEAADGLFHKDDTADRRVTHNPFRRGQAGIVEVNPVLKPTPQEPIKPWSLPLQMENVSDTSVELANQIAARIKSWLDSGEKLESRDRPINPADIMILVRRRSAFVDHMVRALKKCDVPVAGADRMSLREQIVVMDMVALGETLLFPKDDYKLACVLKSPLIGLTDKHLEDLAIGRPGDLWDALHAKAADPAAEKIYGEAFSYLERLQKQAGGERPYEFYSSVLLTACPAGKSGLSCLYGRLGFEAEDPLVEFMNALERFEKIHVPSLQGFLSWLEAGEAEVKREINMNPENPRVHIMTVHGAKGLEAPIVILPDTIGIPEDNPRARPKFLWPTDTRRVPLWAPRGDLESRLFVHEREEAEMERDREFRRLLYVAMTRAADRLYVYGAQNEPLRSDKSWYSLIRKGLEENLDKVETVLPPAPADDFNQAAAPDHVPPPVPDHDDAILRFSVPQTAKPVPDNVKPLEKERVVGVPVWARTNPKAGDPAVERFRPSDYKGINDNVRTAPSPLEGDKKQSYLIDLGIVVHGLFEFLPTLPAADREDAARKFLAKPVWALKERDQEQTLKQVLGVLNDPEFGALFSPNSRPEVSISGFIEKDGKKQMINAQIDRLVVEDKTVMIVDYKNSRHVPKDLSEVSMDYIVQMAAYKMVVQQIYPDKEIKCALLYTREASLMPLPAETLTQALEKISLKTYAPKKTAPGI
jgi:ATP-dependent helicase/nuclease subunit A